MTDGADARWMAAALALGERGRGRTRPNPNVGCILVRDEVVVGRGWTQPSGRPHAEAMALAAAGGAARGAAAYVTLEPCAASGRGPPCAGALVAAGVARVVVAADDPFPAVNGAGYAVLEAAGIPVTRGVLRAEAERSMAGFLIRQRLRRPQVTLKLALSLDGAAAMADGRSRWITGPEARAHAHLERSRHEAILVGRGTWAADRPRLDVRLPGLEGRGPARYVLGSRWEDTETQNASRPFVLSEVEARASEGDARDRPFDYAQGERGKGDALREGWGLLASPDGITTLPADHLLVEGGPATAASFLRPDLVDRLLLYRAPIVVGGGQTLPDIGLADLADAHGRWALADARALGSDRLEVYWRRRD